MFGHAKKHLMWFPFLLVAVTVVLAVTIVIVDQNRNESLEEIAEVLEVVEHVEPAITDDEYQLAVNAVLAPLWPSVESGEGSTEELTGVRDALVSMKVSAEARDVHIRLVAATNQLVKGVEGDPVALADAQVRFTELQTTHVWLK